ncbi:hypothetical protein BGW80DRAFT_851255 [Lactifluus volemus]|nr:hypothetical protein BGW80DRAFT_851255 [Lactifluus volemus]
MVTARYLPTGSTSLSEFCTLWNDITQEACKDEARQIHSHILKPIRHIYIALHKGTGASPTAFNASTNEDNPVLELSSSYPLCNIPSHKNTVVADATSGTTHATSIIASSHYSLPVNVENRTDSSPNFATTATTQGTPDTSTISPPAKSEPHPRPAARVALPSVTRSSPLPSGSTVAQQRNSDLGPLPPSTG